MVSFIKKSWIYICLLTVIAALTFGLIASVFENHHLKRQMRKFAIRAVEKLGSKHVVQSNGGSAGQQSLFELAQDRETG